jgi:two-component system, OmpR family, sensor histidine kinase ResE
MFTRRLSSLPARMLLSFVLLVLLTAVAAGLPAFWIIRNQFEAQAWQLLEQGRHTTDALYANSRSEVTRLAGLTAQRPKLHELVLLGDRAELLDYLHTLQQGAALDVLLICSPRQEILAANGPAPGETTCDSRDQAQYVVAEEGGTTAVWLLASHPLTGLAAGRGQVVVGVRLDDAFMAGLSRQTGLEQTLLVAEQVVASSFAGQAQELPATAVTPGSPEAERSRRSYAVAGLPYYAARYPLADGPLAAELSLPVAELVATQRRLFWLLAGIMLFTALIGSLMSVVLARRISRPLARLAQAATNLSWRDLETPVRVETSVREVAVVASALEMARLELQRALTELQEEKAWVDHLLASIAEGIMTLDKAGRITFFSQGAEQITGWRREQVLQQPCDDFFQLADSSESFHHTLPPSGQRHKMTVILASRRQATLAVTTARLMPPAASEAATALVFRDVSEEEAVHRLLAHFLANVAHEFRTPLSALAASIELLLDQAPDLNPAELEELLASLHLGILGLQTLVDNLLESASIETGRFRVFRRPVDLVKVIEEAAQIMRPLLLKHGQQLRLDAPGRLPAVEADPRRLVQVLVNLLGNAVKYGPDDAEIAVTAVAEPECIRIAVADTGPGIPPEARGDLFRWFSRRPPEGAKEQFGVGLGLAVARAVILAHNGAIGVDDRPGGGSLFWFTLPYESSGGG